MKRGSIFWLFLVLLAVCGFLLSGCGGSQKKKITINVKTPTIGMYVPYDKEVTGSGDLLAKAGKAFSKQYKDAEVTVNVVQYELPKEKDFIEKCYDTPEAVDVLFSDYHSMIVHIYSGRVVPLDDFVTAEQKKDISDIFWRNSTFNNKIYIMPYHYRQNVLAYNKDMMRQAGLGRFVTDEDVIQTWTMEEWEAILSTLRDYLPEGSYPLMMYAKNSTGDAHLMCYIRSQGSKFFTADGYFDLHEPEGVAGLQWIKDCVDKGYMPESAAYMTIHDCFDLWQNRQMVFWLGNTSAFPLFKNPVGAVNFPTVNGGCSTHFISGFEIFDNGDADKLAVSKAFVQYIYNSEYLDYATAGIPCCASVNRKYAKEMAAVKKFIDNAGTAVDFTGGNPNWLQVRDVFYPYIQKLVNGDMTPAEVAAGLDRDANRIIDEGRKKGKFHE